MQQIPLDLLSQDRFCLSKYVVTERTKAVLDTLLKDGLNLTPFLLLLGSKGSGKTHLAHIAANARHAHFITSDNNLSDFSFELKNYVVDDAELISQTYLFHLFNHIQKHNLSLIATSEKHPLEWIYGVPDLASRLNSMRIMVLPEPDETLQIDILKKLFLDRLISPSPEFLDYLIKRCDRSVESMRYLVADIEQFADGRPFNRALARDYLDKSETLPFDGF